MIETPVKAPLVQQRRVRLNLRHDGGVLINHLLEVAASHILDGIELRHIFCQAVALGGERVNHIVGHLAQAGTLLSRNLVERVVHILLGVAVAGEYRLVDVHRVELLLAVVLYVGIHQHSIVEYLSQLAVGDELGRVTREHRGGEQQRCEHYVGRRNW